MTKGIKLSLLFSKFLFIVLLPICMKITQFLHPLVIGVVWFCMTCFILLVSLWIENRKITVSKHILNLVALFYSIGLLILLFFRPENQYYGSINLIPFKTVKFYLSGSVDLLIAMYNIVANIGLFVPFGTYYCYTKNNFTYVQLLTIGFFSITLIECLQFFTKRGSFDIDDLILNLLGMYVGYRLYPLMKNVLVIRAKNSGSAPVRYDPKS